MARINLNKLEEEQQTFIGHRKEVQLHTEMTRRDIKEAQGRESLKERSSRERTSTQRRHEINKTRKELENKLMSELEEEQQEELIKNFKNNKKAYNRIKKQEDRSL